MFTGLVEECGTVVEFKQSTDRARLIVASEVVSCGVQRGDSIAVNGCCLTVAEEAPDRLSFDLLGETLARTNLGQVAPGTPVNLERALSATGRLGGHFVQGHIDCTSPIVSLTPSGPDWRLEVALPLSYARYLAFKGSIAIDGISLTVAEITKETFVVWIIPHTSAVTSLRTREAGDLVNLEFDLLAKYVERILATAD
jgi:riboflavin synthase